MFPLFETIYQSTTEYENQEMSMNEKIKLCEQMQEINQNGHDYVFAIIQQYYNIIEKEKTNYNIYAYSPKQLKKGLKYNTSFLPSRLLYMLQKFLTLHIKKQKEDSQRNLFPFHPV